MDKLVKTLGINSLSKSQVSRMAADLGEQVDQFRHRPLGDAGPFTFVAADALTMKVREGGRVINALVLIATGVNADGRREVLGLRVATSPTPTASTRSSTGSWATSMGSSPTRSTTSIPQGLTSLRSPSSPKGSGSRSGRTTRTNA